MGNEILKGGVAFLPRASGSYLALLRSGDILNVSSPPKWGEMLNVTSLLALLRSEKRA